MKPPTFLLIDDDGDNPTLARSIKDIEFYLSECADNSKRIRLLREFDHKLNYKNLKQSTGNDADYRSFEIFEDPECGGYWLLEEAEYESQLIWFADLNEIENLYPNLIPETKEAT